MMVILQKLILKKLLFTTFYVITSCFSSILFVVIPSTPKLINCFTSVLFTTCFATQQADETFAVTVKIMIDLYIMYIYYVYIYIMYMMYIYYIYYKYNI